MLACLSILNVTIFEKKNNNNFQVLYNIKRLLTDIKNFSASIYDLFLHQSVSTEIVHGY
jgi:hypothetical protein